MIVFIESQHAVVFQIQSPTETDTCISIKRRTSEEVIAPSSTPERWLVLFHQHGTLLNIAVLAFVWDIKANVICFLLFISFLYFIMHISVLLAFQFNYFFPFISCRRGFLKYFKKRLTPQDGNITMAKTLAEKEALGWIILPDPLYSVIIKLILYLFIHELEKK